MRSKILKGLEALMSPSILWHLMGSGSRSFSSVRTFLELRRHVPVIATFLDVGANVGQFSATAAHFYPDAVIHAFEPVPSAFKGLERHARRLPQMAVHPVALGARVGSVDFYVNEFSQISSALPIHEENGHEDYDPAKQTRIVVQMRTLDDVVDLGALKRPVLLKLDVQGYEPEVLEGARELLAHVDYLLLEMPFMKLYEGQADFDDLYRIVTAKGFHVRSPLTFHRSSSGISEADMLFERREGGRA